MDYREWGRNSGYAFEFFGNLRSVFSGRAASIETLSRILAVAGWYELRLLAFIGRSVGTRKIKFRSMTWLCPPRERGIGIGRSRAWLPALELLSACSIRWYQFSSFRNGCAFVPPHWATLICAHSGDAFRLGRWWISLLWVGNLCVGALLKRCLDWDSLLNQYLDGIFLLPARSVLIALFCLEYLFGLSFRSIWSFGFCLDTRIRFAAGARFYLRA